MNPPLIPLLIAAIFILISCFGLAVTAFFKNWVRIAAHDEVIIKTGAGGVKAIIGGSAVVIPKLHRYKKLKIHPVVLDIDTQDLGTIDGQKYIFRVRLVLTPNFDHLRPLVRKFCRSTDKSGSYLEIDRELLKETAKSIVNKRLAKSASRMAASKLTSFPDNILETQIGVKDTRHYLDLDFSAICGMNLTSSTIMVIFPRKENKSITVVDTQASTKCPYCHDEIVDKELSVTCDSCNTIHHADCFSEHNQCSTHACQSREAKLKMKA